MIYFVGAGSGAPDLITVRGARLLSEADVIVYAGCWSIRHFWSTERTDARYTTARR